LLQHVQTYVTQFLVVDGNITKTHIHAIVKYGLKESS